MTTLNYVVFDKDGNPWGPFDDATEAAAWCAKKWPDQHEHTSLDTDHVGEGWIVAALRAPD